MKSKKHFASVIILFFILSGFTGSNSDWKSETKNGYTIFFKKSDIQNIKEYEIFIEKGITNTTHFINRKYKNNFQVYVHPQRESLDSAWQRDWNMPAFKSECWMVASGIATKLDIISPKMWEKESCEHNYAETEKTQQLITHELVHVFHGQLNPSPDFSNTTGIDWFVEGLATYVSGQCDSVRISEVVREVSKGNFPVTLDDFWKGKNKYGLSGSMVMYIDKKYGREQLTKLLYLTNKAELLSALHITEETLIEECKLFLLK